MLLGFKIFFMVYKLGLKKKEPKQCLKLSEEEMMQNIHLLGRRTELMERAARPGHHSGLQPLLSECLTQLQQDSVYCRHSSCTLQVAFCYSCTWNWFTKKLCRSLCLKKGRKRRKKEGIKWAGFCVSVLLSDNTSSENSRGLGGCRLLGHRQIQGERMPAPLPLPPGTYCALLQSSQLLSVEQTFSALSPSLGWKSHRSGFLFRTVLVQNALLDTRAV